MQTQTNQNTLRVWQPSIERMSVTVCCVFPRFKKLNQSSKKPWLLHNIKLPRHKPRLKNYKNRWMRSGNGLICWIQRWVKTSSLYLCTKCISTCWDQTDGKVCNTWPFIHIRNCSIYQIHVVALCGIAWAWSVCLYTSVLFDWCNREFCVIQLSSTLFNCKCLKLHVDIYDNFSFVSVVIYYNLLYLKSIFTRSKSM